MLIERAGFFDGGTFLIRISRRINEFKILEIIENYRIHPITE